MPAPGAGERVHGRHQHGQEQRPGQHRQHQAGQHLAHRLDVALGAVLGARPLVHGRERPQRGAPERSEPVRVDGGGLVRVRWQLPASGDPHRVVALLQQGALGADPDRERQPGELAERPAAPARVAELLPDRVRDGALEADAGACRVTGPRLQDRALVRPRTEVRDHEHGVDQVRLGQHLHEPAGAHLAEVGAVHRGQHQRLLGRSPLVDAGELHERGGVGGAAGRLGHAGRVARGHDHDLAARAAGPAADHVDELVARVGEPLHERAHTSARREPARGERVGHELGGRPVAARPGAPVGRLGGDPLRQRGGLGAVEEDVGGQSLR